MVVMQWSYKREKRNGVIKEKFQNEIAKPLFPKNLSFQY